ncbi:MAG: hypothetical protein WDW36_008518 [Sanguina aurantia]
MVDAEHSYFQPAIDHFVTRLMRKHNTQGPAVVFNTYQAYTKDCEQRVRNDMCRAQREGYTFAAKLVRGAYLTLERERAAAQSYPSPCHDTLEATHASFDACSDLMLKGVAAGGSEVLLGSHNQASIQLAVARMSLLDLDPRTSPVYFGQLLGMSDHLTFTLGKHGYRAFKYVPYGKVDEVIPYLLRRAQENKAVLKGVKEDVLLLSTEMRQRFAKATGVM